LRKGEYSHFTVFGNALYLACSLSGSSALSFPTPLLLTYALPAQSFSQPSGGLQHFMVMKPTNPKIYKK
jgi:hypothetical protein